jgi:SAM-dependent methyltransferase/uncharacterized coiled-coil protein SlyX
METEDFDKLIRGLAEPRATWGDRVGQRTEAVLAPAGRRSADPRLDIETLVEIMDSSRKDRIDDSTQERLQALHAWRDALVHRHDLAQRLAGNADVAPLPLALAFTEAAAQRRGLAGAFESQREAALDLRGLERASSHALIDRVIPPFAHRGPVLRVLARWMARAVSFLARFVTTRQSLVNTILVEYLAETAYRLNKQQEKLDRLARDAQRLLAEEREETAVHLRELQAAAIALGQDVERLRLGVHEGRRRSSDHEVQLADLECAKTWSQVAELDGRKEFGRVRQAVGRVGAQAAGQETRIAGQESRIESLTQGLAQFQRHLSEQGERIDGQRQAVAALQDLVARADSMEESLADLTETLQRSVGDEQSGGGQEQPPGHVNGPLEGLYVNLENEFRGSRKLVSDRLASYLPLLRETGAGTVDHPILDLGSGRGEWLELLRNRGLAARGIETNSVAVSNCRTLGLDVTAADALEYLREQPGRSLGMVSAFHLLEHLPFDYVVELLGESLRVLEPGGVALFETPNPENLVVSAKSFHCDPTHRRPLVPELLVFLMQQQGFSRLRIERQTDGRPDDRLPDLDASDPLADRLNPVIALLNRHFAAPSDFAVIGYRST